MDLSGAQQTCFDWAEYQPELAIPAENAENVDTNPFREAENVG